MRYSIVFSQRARQHIIDGHDWYEDKEEGLGDRFLECVTKRIEIISKYPERYPQRSQLFRECPIDIFPYLIVYQLRKQKQQVIVTAVFSTWRNPRIKYKK
jgi:plasmid stabilization system protein ParE